MKRILFILFGAVFITSYFRIAAPFDFNQQNQSIVSYTNNERIFFDDFNQHKLNSKWYVYDQKTKNGRIGTFNNDNVKIVHNQLRLSTTFNQDGSVQSGYINAQNDDNGNPFNYGYYEARIKFTNNNNIADDESEIAPGYLKPWGAFWLYPLKYNQHLATEVDIVENQSANYASASIHPMNNQQVVENIRDQIDIKNHLLTTDTTKFHTYGVAILPNDHPDAADYQFYVDNQLITEASSNIPLSQQVLHLTMEFATTDYQSLATIDPDIAKNLKNEAMYIDYVAVYSID